LPLPPPLPFPLPFPFPGGAPTAGGDTVTVPFGGGSLGGTDGGTLGCVGVGVGVSVGDGDDERGDGVGVKTGAGLSVFPTLARGGKSSTFMPFIAPSMNAVQTRAG
jgi:hypothetical protein